MQIKLYFSTWPVNISFNDDYIVIQLSANRLPVVEPLIF